MPYEVTEPEFDLHDENKFYYGDLISIQEEVGKFGTQLKWVIHLDNETYIDDDGNEVPRETWTWCTNKLTTHENNGFRKYVKGLLGKEPEKGQLFNEEHWTKTYYENNPSADPVALTGKEQPWRVGVMFEHTKRDGKDRDKVLMLVSESSTR